MRLIAAVCAALFLAACASVSTGQRRVAATHGGWGLVAEVGEDGQLDALFVRAPEGVTFSADDEDYIVRVGPSSQGRASIRVIRTRVP
jgi:hypothetical protein